MTEHEEGILAGLAMAKKVAEAHISYDKKNELFAKFPAGDQVVSMAGMIRNAIWQMEIDLQKDYSKTKKPL